MQTENDDRQTTEPISIARPDESAPARTIRSAELLQGARELLIQHDESTYRLRLTRNGKLILVK
jgi:hemin uptake protein HemP